MRKIIGVMIVGVLSACATQHDVTKAFQAQEKKVADMCLVPVMQLPAEARTVVDARTGRSALTNAAWCYSNQIKSVARMTNYPHAALVGDFADYLTRLTTARDRGIVSTPIAVAAYQQTAGLFRQSIVDADARLEAQARKQVADRIATFGLLMAAVSAEQDRQRAANRPVVCSLTGVYVQNTVVCN
jgi:hypothetical protein